MISSVTKKVGKKTLKLKLSTRALVRLEAENGGKPFADLMDDLLQDDEGADVEGAGEAEAGKAKATAEA